MKNRTFFVSADICFNLTQVLLISGEQDVVAVLTDC